MNKTHLALIFGGPSAEHNVSLVSAKCILAELDKSKFDVLPLGIAKSGSWHLVHPEHLAKTEFDKPFDIVASGPEVFLIRRNNEVHLVEGSTGKTISVIAVAFPIVHGPCGEDGALQGFFKLLRLPFVGCDITASSLCMDKEYTKRILQQVGLPVGKFEVYKEPIAIEDIWKDVSHKFKLPIYIKPANMGSSVGVHKVTQPSEFKDAALDAFKYDTKILVEENIEGLEVEVAVLGNQKPMASESGAFWANDQFYTYEAKYLNQNGATFRVPATDDPTLNEEIRVLALSVYQALDCRGLSRVDLFLTPTKKLYVNEVNTLPGFTPISMYPKLWSESGKAYQELLSELVVLALDEQTIRDSKMQL